MTTAENFYFSFDEVKNSIAVSSDGTDFNLIFLPITNGGIAIKITMRGEENYLKLVKLISSLSKKNQ